jgi:hypothetical protein
MLELSQMITGSPSEFKPNPNLDAKHLSEKIIISAILGINFISFAGCSWFIPQCNDPMGCISVPTFQPIRRGLILELSDSTCPETGTMQDFLLLLAISIMFD